MKARLLLPFFVLIGSACSRPSQIEVANDSTPRSICSIGFQDYGEVVRLSAIYETDLRHGSILSDSHCPDVTIAIGFDADGVDDTIESFDKSLRAVPFKPGMVRMKVVVTGRIEGKAPARPEFRRIHLDSAKNLE